MKYSGTYHFHSLSIWVELAIWPQSFWRKLRKVELMEYKWALLHDNCNQFVGKYMGTCWEGFRDLVQIQQEKNAMHRCKTCWYIVQQHTSPLARIPFSSFKILWETNLIRKRLFEWYRFMKRKSEPLQNISTRLWKITSTWATSGELDGTLNLASTDTGKSTMGNPGGSNSWLDCACL